MATFLNYILVYLPYKTLIIANKLILDILKVYLIFIYKVIWRKSLEIGLMLQSLLINHL